MIHLIIGVVAAAIWIVGVTSLIILVHESTRKSK
jgi:hypothetical protein